MEIRNIFSRTLVTGLAALAAGLSASGSAMAASDNEQLEEVVVTGSRLQANGFNAPTPVTVVNAEIIEARAPANLADVLVEQPAFRAQLPDTSRNAGGLPQNVQATLDLRAMGAQRTLTLINGHRSVGTNWDSTVDSNIVPVGLVERVDVVTGGASAAYGSDAVAGVVNILLRNKLEGIRATAQTGYTQYEGAKQYTMGLSGGTSLLGGRLHLIGGIDYNNSKAIENVYGKRWAQDEIGNTSPTAAQRLAGGLPGTVIATGVEPASTAPGGVYVAASGLAYTFDGNGNPVLYNRGTTLTNCAGTSATNCQFQVGSNLYYGHNTGDITPLRLGLTRIDTMGRATFDINDRVSVYLEVGNSRTSISPYRANEIQQGQGFGNNNPNISIARTNPFVTPALLSLIGTATTFNIGRMHSEFGTHGMLGGQIVRQEYETRRYVLGLDGNFGSGWKWDAYYQVGRTKLNQQRNDYSTLALQKAVNGCDTSNNFNATQITLVNRYESLSGKRCVPFNPFGLGRNTQAAYDYVQNPTQQIQHISLDAAAATISGTPFPAPAGRVAIAAGAEYRKEYLAADSDDVSAAGAAVDGALLAGSLVESFGRTSVKEAFLEVGVPLFKSQPWAKTLDLNAALRVTDYELSGTVKTWKAGMIWEPLDSLRVRFTRSHDIRAPNIRALFFRGGPNGAQVNTTALKNGTVGRDGTVYSGAASASTTLALSVPGASGNPNLTPEIADTTTGGVVFAKSGFTTSLDYYEIVMKDAIANPNNQQVIDFCVAGDPTYCNMITFAPVSATAPGGIGLLEPLALNLNKVVIKGYDFEASYRHMLGTGNFTVRALINYQPHNFQVNTLTGITTENANTLGNQPKVGYNFSFGYGQGRWDADVQVRGFTQRRGNNIQYNADGSINVATTLGPEDSGYAAANAVSLANLTATTQTPTNPTINKNRWPGQFTVNPSFNFKVNEHISAFANIDNLFDVGPPPLSTSNVYDLIGRRYRVGVRANY